MVQKKNRTGNLLLNSGDLLKFSVSGLKEVLEDSNSCVLCGVAFAANEDLVETREHIVPKWVINHCDLDESFALQPNRQRNPYSKLTVRCCQKCNTSYSYLFEKPLSVAFKDGFESVMALYNTEGGKNLIFGWVAFIAAKKRLHSAMHRFDPNTQISSEVFEDEQGLDSISWMLAVPASLRFGNRKACSRFLAILSTNTQNDKPAAFDLLIDPLANTALLTIGNTSVICGFSHSCPQYLSASVMHGFSPNMTFSQLQIRELFAEFSAQALSFERKYYVVKEFDGCLSFGMDESSGSQLLVLPRSFWMKLLLETMGDLPVHYIISQEYWDFVVSSLSNGLGSFFPNRGGQQYFDPLQFQGNGSELTEDDYYQRIQQLQVHARVSEPLCFEDLQESFGCRI